MRTCAAKVQLPSECRISHSSQSTYFDAVALTMGETQMGRFKFSSWTLHMASIMIFSTLWGIALREWAGTSRHTRRLVALTLLVLIASTVIIGYGNSLASTGTH